MSSLNPPYVTYIYPHRCPLTWEWLNDLLFKLWMRGITFSHSIPPKASWEEELLATEFVLQGNSAPTLGEALKESLARGSLYLAFWDGDLQYEMDIDPNGDEEIQELERYQDNTDVEWLAQFEEERKKREALGRVALYCDMSRKDRLYGAKLAQVKEIPYLRAYRGHMHWSKVLCEILDPLFALGDVWSELPEDGHLHVWELVARGELPDVAFYLQKKASCYLPAKAFTVERLTEILAIPRCSFQRLPNGGVFFSVTHPPFCYEESTAQLQILQGTDLLYLEQSEERPMTEEVTKERVDYLRQVLLQGDLDEIKRYFQRALMIYSTIKDNIGVRKTENLLRWLEDAKEED